MGQYWMVASGGALVVGLPLLIALIFTWRSSASQRKRFSVIVDADEEAQRILAAAETEAKKTEKQAQSLLRESKQKAEATVAAAATEASRIRTEADAAISEAAVLKQKYATALQRYESLKAQVAALEEDLENVELGLYRPHFTYNDSASYKTAISLARDSQKRLIRLGDAITTGKRWKVNDSYKEGEKMINQNKKLFLRAFNAESEAAIANVTWSNYQIMQNRITKAFDAINALGTSLELSISDKYRDSRLNELKLVFEEAEKRQQEREEARRQRAEQREEERVQRELEREREEAERESRRHEKALEKARAEMAAANEAEKERLEAKLAQLQVELDDARSRQERAIAQAQLTKSGHVYIISNIGAFGEGVVKIGVTRRLDPEERIRELGDASVPFPFDPHGLIRSDNAPELERKLHELFWDRRLNWSNDRKEFFRVSLEEVAVGLKSLGFDIGLAAVAEAREYRETLVARDGARSKPVPETGRPNIGEHPVDPFA